MGDLLNIGASATELYRQALSTVSNNIANLNSDGYSRQEVRAEEIMPTANGVTYLGAGVASKGVFRAVDEFATASLRTATSRVQEQEPIMRYTNRVLDLLGSEEGSLSNAISDFFSSTSKLAGNAAEEGFRQEFLMSANFLAGRSQAIGAELSSLHNEMVSELETQFAELNKTAASLARVNKELGKTALDGKQPPMLLDQRDFLLKELAQYAGIDVKIDSSERALVKLTGTSDSMRFVTAEKAYLLDPQIPEIADAPIAITLDAYGRNLNIGTVKQGTIGGTLSFRDSIFEPLRDDLDVLVSTVAESINNLHEQGLNRNGDVGAKLFDMTPRYTAINAGDRTASSLISVTAPEGTPEVAIQAVWDAPKNRWLVTDLATNQSRYVDSRSSSDAGFSFGGLTVDATASLANGQVLIIKPEARAIDTLRVAVLNTDQIATADRLQVESAIDNAHATAPRLSYGQRASALNSFAAVDGSTVLGLQQSATVATNSAEPALFIPRDANGFSVSIQPNIDDDHQLQLFTSEHNHLVGSATLATDFATALAASQSIEDGTDYINSSLNRTGTDGYKDTAMTLGNFSSASVLSSSIPVQTNSSGAAVDAIAAAQLTLNGTDLPALAIDANSTLSAAEIADWINDGTGTAGSLGAVTGVSAQAEHSRSFDYSDFDLTRKLSINGVTIVNTGIPTSAEALASLINTATFAAGDEVIAIVHPSDRIEIRPSIENTGKNMTFGNPTAGENANFLGLSNGVYTGSVRYTNDGAVPANGTAIEFAFKDYGAGVGKATDLSRLGLATTLTSNTRLDDDFLVYVTGSPADATLRYDLGQIPDLPKVEIEAGFSLEFLGTNKVQITDTDTGTVMAQKDYAWPNGVLVNDVMLSFDEAPAAGDIYTVSPNEGALADNGNIQRILAVKDRGVDGDQIPLQRYISLVSKVGNDHNLAKMSSEALRVVADDAQALLDNTVGVTLDTEAADLIRYQQSYQAAAQIIQASQEIFDMLIAASR